jgi:hypothetical protein
VLPIVSCALGNSSLFITSSITIGPELAATVVSLFVVSWLVVFCWQDVVSKTAVIAATPNKFLLVIMMLFLFKAKAYHFNGSIYIFRKL